MKDHPKGQNLQDKIDPKSLYTILGKKNEKMKKENTFVTISKICFLLGIFENKIIS